MIDTILHEVAHALAGPQAGHGPEWRAACERVGARSERCYDSTIAMPQGRLVAECGECGKEFRRHKRLRRGRTSYCTACGPERGRLTYQVIATEPLRTDKTPLDAPPTPKRLRG